MIRSSLNIEGVIAVDAAVKTSELRASEDLPIKRCFLTSIVSRSSGAETVVIHAVPLIRGLAALCSSFAVAARKS
jgi:hypothetical protein